jgi:EAL domain-containing protein (putative c-di-GMP-specific phosphodiesterase class I)
LRELGIELLIDDFGTGFSSLSRLTRFPLHKLKIDRSFVTNIPDNGHDSTVASTIVAMAHSLGLGVIAEGVETEAQAEFLRFIGCEEMQGYLFSKPVGASAFEQLLRDGKHMPLRPATSNQRSRERDSD